MIAKRSTADCTGKKTTSKAERREKDMRYITRSLLAGGIAGCAAKTCIAPLDRVKILFQTSNPVFEKYSGSFFGVFRAIGAIYNQHGALGLLQGHSATLLRIFPYAAIKFMSYEQYRSLLMPDKASENAGRRMLAGSLAGITSVFFSYPLELIRVRLAFEVKKSRGSVTIWNTCKTIYREMPLAAAAATAGSSHGIRLQGIKNFFRGFMPTIYGIIPYAGVSFLTYETIKDHFLHNSLLTPYTLSPSASSEKDAKPMMKTWSHLLCGALSGALAQTSSYPFEVIRRNMQVSGLHPERASFNTAQMAKYIYQQKGFRGFFVGLTIGYLKVVPMFAVSFYVYEYAKIWLDIS